MRKRVWLGVLASAMLVTSMPSYAQDTNTPKPREACAADVQKLCANIQPGGGRIAKCMRDNVDKLSQPCRASI